MNQSLHDDNADLYQLIARPLYFGLMVNVILPMALLFACYYINNNSPLSNRVGDSANLLFYIFGPAAIAQAGVALWQRNRRFGQPMIRSEASFDDDLGDSMMRILRPVFVTIALISAYGYVYFFLTGRFQETVFLVIFSFVVFQVVRPRIGYARKLVARQKELMEQGRFLGR